MTRIADLTLARTRNRLKREIAQAGRKQFARAECPVDTPAAVRAGIEAMLRAASGG